MTQQLTMEQKQIYDSVEIKLSLLKDNVKIRGQMLMLLGQLEMSQSFNRNQFRSHIKRFLENSKELLSLQNNKIIYNSLQSAMQLIKTPEDCYQVLVPLLAMFLGAERQLKQENKQTSTDNHINEKQLVQNNDKSTQNDKKSDFNTPDHNELNKSAVSPKINQLYDKQSPTIDNNNKLKGLTYDELVSGNQQSLLQDYDQSADQLVGQIIDSKQKFRDKMNNIVKQSMDERMTDSDNNKLRDTELRSFYSINQSCSNKQMAQTSTKDVQTDEREPVAYDDNTFQVKVDSSMQHTTLPHQIDQSKQLTKAELDKLQREFIQMYNAKIQTAIKKRVDACKKLRDQQIQKAKAILLTIDNLKRQINGQLIYKITDIDLKIFNTNAYEQNSQSILNIKSLYNDENNIQELQDTTVQKMNLTMQLQESIPICDTFFSQLYLEMIKKKQYLLKKLTFALPMQKYIKLKQIVQLKQVDLLASTKRLVNIKQVCSYFLVRVAVKYLLDVKKQQRIAMLYLYKCKLNMMTKVKKDLMLSLCKLKFKQLIIERRRLNNLILISKKLSMPRLPIITKNVTLVQTHLNFYIDQIRVVRMKISKINSLRQQMVQLRIEHCQQKKCRIKKRILILMKKQKMLLLYQKVVQLKQRALTLYGSQP